MSVLTRLTGARRGTGAARAAQAAQTAGTRSRLAELADQDEVVAPLARLHALAADTAGWEVGVRALDAARLAEGLPLLHRETLTVDARRVVALLDALAGTLADGADGADGAALSDAVRRGAIEPLALLEAAVSQDTARLAGLADGADVPLEPLLVLAQLAAQPLLRACGRHAAGLLMDATWDAGYCPVCAAWPVLAERRGLERLRFLRCARCAAAWRYYLQRCPYCGNRDPKTLGYLAPEAQREARQAATCDACRGYLKSVATVAPLSPDDVVATDLTTLELDVAALEHGYARPDERGFPLEVRVIDGGG